MNLLGRVLIMTVCVFTAYALPNLGDIQVAQESSLLKAMLSQLQSAMVQVNPLANATNNNTQDSCFAAYINRQDQVNKATSNQTQACYDSANRNMATYSNNTNKTMSAVNSLSKDLQVRLANCSAKNTTDAVFNCYVSTFDLNLANLNALTAQSQLAEASLSGYEFEVNVARQACIGNVLIGNKSNTTAASNDLELCLINSTWSNNSTGGSNSTNPGNKTMTYYLN